MYAWYTLYALSYTFFFFNLARAARNFFTLLGNQKVKYNVKKKETMMNILTLMSNLLFFSQSDFRFSCFLDRSEKKRSIFFLFDYPIFQTTDRGYLERGKKSDDLCPRASFFRKTDNDFWRDGIIFFVFFLIPKIFVEIFFLRW